MLRKLAPSRAHKPLYRQILRDAFRSAWKNKCLWPLALFAMILQSGGIMDVMFYTVDRLSSRLYAPVDSNMGHQLYNVLAHLFHASNGVDVLNSISAVQSLIVAGTLILAMLGLSVISQGALIFGLGRIFRGMKPDLRESLRVGAQSFFPVAIVNFANYLFVWIISSLLLIPAGAYLDHPSVGNVALYMVLLLAFIICSIVSTTIHLFAVNAIVFEHSPAMEAIKAGWNLLYRHWLIIVELSLLLLCIGIGLLIAGFLTFLLTGIPLFLFMLAFNLIGISSLFYLVYVLAACLFIVIMLSVGALHVTIQYATWERLYQRTVSGSPLAKIHRWLHWLFHPTAS